MDDDAVNSVRSLIEAKRARKLRMIKRTEETTAIWKMDSDLNFFCEENDDKDDPK